MLNLDKMVADAIKKLTLFISRSAGQHKRQMLAAWRSKK